MLGSGGGATTGRSRGMSLGMNMGMGMLSCTWQASTLSRQTFLAFEIFESVRIVYVQLIGDSPEHWAW